MRKIFLCFGLFCLGTSALAQQGDPDLILFNGKIFTSVVARPYVEALAIRGERIVAAGDTKTIQAMAGPKTNVIDLHGGTAIPGINDAHHHFQLGPPEVDVDLRTMDPSWAQVKDGILAAVAKNPPNSLISVTTASRSSEIRRSTGMRSTRLHRTIRCHSGHSPATA